MDFSTKLTIFCLCCVLYSALTSGLDEDAVKEKTCFEPDTSAVELDYEWVFSNSRWYFTMMSKLDLYRTASDTFKKSVTEISENEVKTPCLYADWEGFSPSIIGFKGKKLEYEINPGFDNTFTFGAEWRNGKGGKMYLVKTDNQSYILFIKCWESDNQVSWNVMSTTPKLSESIKSEIYSAVESFGLSKNLGVELEFTGCGLGVKSEL